MSRGIAALVTLAVMIAIVWGASEKPPAAVMAGRLTEENWDRLVPDGKEVDAIYGDFVLQNEFLTAVIADPLPTRNANMTVKQVAGSLIDLTRRDSNGDQLSAFYPGRREFAFRSAEIRHGDAATVHSGAGIAADSVCEVVVSAEAGNGKPAVETVYRLGRTDHRLTVITRYKNTGDVPVKVTLEDDIRADGQKEDMQKSPAGADSLFWIHDRFWDQAYGVIAAEGNITANSDSRTSVLRYDAGDGTADVTLQPGETRELTRYLYAGRNLLDIRADAARHAGQDVLPVSFVVKTTDGRPLPHGTIEITREGKPYGNGRLSDSGELMVDLPKTEYAVSITSLGVPVSETPIPFAVLDGGSNLVDITPSNWQPGSVSARITDADGELLPAKVQFLPIGDTPTPDWGPETADFAVRNVRYAPQGTFSQSIPAGRYQVIVSRGPEYDAVFTELTVPPGETVALHTELIRTVQTPGWVSADFHSHSSPSGDNTSSQLGRVINLVCEHIEFAPCTEHNRVSTYEPHIARLGIEDYLATVSGMELTGTPLPLNHQNVFPMVHRPRTQDGGGPTTDASPETQVERLALWDDRSEKLIQQNHPDLGWLFYDKNGDAKPDEGFSRVFPLLDVIEIHPVDAAIQLSTRHADDEARAGNRMFHWLQLLNQGYRIPGVVNTDAHYNYHGSGWLRNWIHSSSDRPRRINVNEMVTSSEGGEVIMSNGPYLEVNFSTTLNPDGVTAGQNLVIVDGRVIVHARVQCPNWIDIDRVFLLVNGREHAGFSFSREDHPDMFHGGTIKFDESMEIDLPRDSHLIVVAAGVNEELGPVLGPAMSKTHPAAISNPAYIDVDGSGFEPNKDTLGLPLPVRRSR